MEINNPFKYFFNFPCGYFKGLKDKVSYKESVVFWLRFLFFFKMEKKINQFILRFEEEIFFFLLKKRFC